MEKRCRRRTRDLVTQPASHGLSENENRCARKSIVAKSANDLLTGRIQKRKTNPSVTHIRLATHGRSIHWVMNVDFGQSDTRPFTPESDHTVDTERGRRRGQKRTRVLQQAFLTCVLGA